MWQWATFMEKVKKGYPYRDEIKNVIGKKHDMKWTKWTSFYYPNSSDRHTEENSDGWRHNIDFAFVDKVFNELFPNDDIIIDKYRNKFSDYIRKTEGTPVITDVQGNWVKNIFGTGAKDEEFYSNKAHLGKEVHLDSHTGIYAKLGEKEYPIIRNQYRDWETDRKSTRLNSSHSAKSRMPSSA